METQTITTCRDLGSRDAHRLSRLLGCEIRIGKGGVILYRNTGRVVAATSTMPEHWYEEAGQWEAIERSPYCRCFAGGMQLDAKRPTLWAAAMHTWARVLEDWWRDNRKVPVPAEGVEWDARTHAVRPWHKTPPHDICPCEQHSTAAALEFMRHLDGSVIGGRFAGRARGYRVLAFWMWWKRYHASPDEPLYDFYQREPAAGEPEQDGMARLLQAGN